MNLRSFPNLTSLIPWTALGVTALLPAGCNDIPQSKDPPVDSIGAAIEIAIEPDADDMGDDIGDDTLAEPATPQCKAKGPRRGWGPNSCANPEASCDDGGIKPSEDPKGVGYSVDLRPFLLDGAFGIGECNPKKPPKGTISPPNLRPLAGGAAPVTNTNFTAFDFGGTDFDILRGNTHVDAQNGRYEVLLQRYVVTPDEQKVLLNYRHPGVTWEYQASNGGKKSTTLTTNPVNPFTAPQEGDLSINLVRTDFVSVRFQVTSEMPSIGISALRFRARATDGSVEGQFISDENVDGAIVQGKVSPNPSSVGGFVSTWKNGRVTVTGEVLLLPGKTYRFEDAAVELSGLTGKRLSVVSLPISEINVKNKCDIYTAETKVIPPKGQLSGGVFFERDPVEPPASGPHVRKYSVPYTGATDKNEYNGERAGVDIHGKEKLLFPGGDNPIKYDYQAIQEGRWGLSVCDPGPRAWLDWPSGAQGWFRWPAPGINAIEPVDKPDNSRKGLDRDAFTFVDKFDPPASNPELPYQTRQEVISLGTKMAYVTGNIEVGGCIGATSVFSGNAFISGLEKNDGIAEQFSDERGNARAARTGTTGGAASGVFLSRGRYEIAASEGLWKEGGYHVGFRRGISANDPSYYHGTLGVRVLHPDTYTLVPGRTNAVQGPTRAFTTGEIRTTVRVFNEDGTQRPFKSPSAYIGSRKHPYGYTSEAEGNGVYYASSKGSAALKTDHPITLIGLAESSGNVRIRAYVPISASGNGRGLWMSHMMRNVSFTEESCRQEDKCGRDSDKDGIGDICDNCVDVANKSQWDSNKDNVGDACETVCVTIRRGDGGDVSDTFLASNELPKNFGGAHELLVGTPPKMGFTWSLLNFNLPAILKNKPISSATMTLVGMETSEESGEVAMSLVGSSWSENTVTAASFPNTLGINVGGPFPGGIGVVSVPLNTAIVEAWANHNIEPNGILLSQQAGTFTQFASSENELAWRPRLQVCYPQQSPE